MDYVRVTIAVDGNKGTPKTGWDIVESSYIRGWECCVKGGFNLIQKALSITAAL